MFETIDKTLLAGLGALSITRERAEKLFDEYVRRGQAVKEARTGFVKELLDSAERTRRDLEKLINEQVHQAVSKMELATRDDLKRLEAKLDAVLQARS